MESNKEKFEKLIEKACDVYTKKEDKKFKKSLKKAKKEEKKK